MSVHHCLSDPLQVTGTLQASVSLPSISYSHPQRNMVVEVMVVVELMVVVEVMVVVVMEVEG